MADKDDKPWFAPKRYGYGAGLPIAWQGWLLAAGYGLAVLVAVLVADRSPLACLSIIISATALLLIFSARRTRGGWRWRWGGEKE